MRTATPQSPAVLLFLEESMPDLKTSWDNLMWNMEFDDDDMESEDLMKSARNAVMAALAEVSV